MNITGYLHPGYAHSLAAHGSPRQLPGSKGWILERPIAGTSAVDGMGLYPLFTCIHWDKLHDDLEHLGDSLVSLSLVTDPFGRYTERELKTCFPDLVLPFKRHFVIDLSQEIEEHVSRHHRRNTRKVLRTIRVEEIPNPMNALDEWVNLYTHLISRHDLSRFLSFSPEIFAGQLQIPGIVVFRAVHQDDTVGMLIWYVMGDVGYYHLGAYSPSGYELGSSFALFWHAIEWFKKSPDVRWLSLGAGPGLRADAKDGLSRFKRGWSTETRIVYFCGRIFDSKRYIEITQSRGNVETDYFPAYRQSEFSP